MLPSPKCLLPFILLSADVSLFCLSIPCKLPQHDMVKVKKIMSEQNKTRPIGSN